MTEPNAPSSVPETVTFRVDDLTPDPATANADAADIIGFVLATAEAGATPDDVLASVDVADCVRLTLSALKVAGSLVRHVPDAREFLIALAADIRAEDA